MRWIGYFFLVLFLLFLLIIFIKIKIEFKLSKQEQWVEVRYLMLKYRVNLDDYINFKPKTDEGKKSSEVNKASESKSAVESKTDKVRTENVNTEVKSPKTDEVESVEKPKVNTANLNKTEEMLVETGNKEVGVEIPPLKEKSKRRWMIKAPKVLKRLKTPKARRWLKVPKVININFIRKININYLQAQYRRFKFIYKEGKIILYRLFGRIRIHRLDATLSFNIDDPTLNAHLIAAVWAVEANFYSFLQRRFKKVRNHKFDVKTQFSGNNIFLDLSCIVSVRVVDIIIVALFSIKEILTIYRMVTLTKSNDEDSDE